MKTKLKILYDHYDSALGYFSSLTIDRGVTSDVGGFQDFIETLFSNYDIEYIKSKEADKHTDWIYPVYINNIWFLNSITQIKKIVPNSIKYNQSKGKIVVFVFEPISDFKIFSQIAGEWESELIFVTYNYSEHKNIIFYDMSKKYRNIGMTVGDIQLDQLSSYSVRKFSCFNKWYYEDKYRLYFTSILEKMNLLDDFFLTLHENGRGFDTVKSLFSTTTDLTFTSVDKVFDSLDIEETFNKSLVNIYFEPTHIVSGGNYLLSEKPARCFAHKIPFIAFSHPGAIEFYKSFGFKTFHPFINESYDKETNTDKRLALVFKEIKRLNTLSVNELTDRIQKLAPILEHNAETLKKLDSSTADKIVAQMKERSFTQ